MAGFASYKYVDDDKQNLYITPNYKCGGRMFSLLLLVGIVVWPELALCVLLFASGHPILGIIALLTTFCSGSRLMVNRAWGFIFGAKTEKKLPDLGDA